MGIFHGLTGIVCLGILPFFPVDLPAGVLAGGECYTVREYPQRLVARRCYPHLLYLPTEYVYTGKKWPLLVFLHGSSKRGTGFDHLKTCVPIQYMSQQGWLPFLVAAPQLDRGERWDSERLDALIRDISSRYEIDQNRIYMTGISLGGYGAFDFANDFPDRLAAVAPVCGGAKLSMVDNLARVPIWTFHGSRDRVVPIGPAAAVMRSLERRGDADANFTVFPGAGHDIWHEAYGNGEIYRWMLRQRSGREVQVIVSE